MSVRTSWRSFNALVTRYVMKFGVVGVIAYGVDVGIFNALRLDLHGDGPILASSFAAKTISVAIATLVSWFGNRYWTFREHRRTNFILELLEFTAIAVVGMGIALFCLWFSHSVLGFDSLLADNVAANVVGLALATSFRFVMYRMWVYGDHRTGKVVAGAGAMRERNPSGAV